MVSGRKASETHDLQSLIRLFRDVQHSVESQATLRISEASHRNLELPLLQLSGHSLRSIGCSMLWQCLCTEFGWPRPWIAECTGTSKHNSAGQPENRDGFRNGHRSKWERCPGRHRNAFAERASVCRFAIGKQRSVQLSGTSHRELHSYRDRGKYGNGPLARYYAGCWRGQLP